MGNIEAEYRTIEYEASDYPVRVDFEELEVNAYKNTEAAVLKYDAIIVLIVNNGVLRVTSGNRGFNVEAGQGIIINRLIPFKILLVSDENCGFYSVAFSERFVCPEGDLYEKYAREFVEAEDLSLIQLQEKNLRDDAIIDGINRVIAVNLIKKKGYELVTRGILCNIWMLLYEYASEDEVDSTADSLSSRDDARVRAACDYISEHYGDMLTLDDIADHIHLSPSECCRCFKRVLFKTPIEFLMEYRVFSAARILFKDPKAADSMSELSFITGFNNPSYFNKVFKRYMQCTPTRYRRMIKEDPEQAERLYITMQEGVTLL